MQRITDVAGLRAAVARRARVLITDTANGDKVHQTPSPHVLEENFIQKVVQNAEQNGRYFELDPGESIPQGAQRCRFC